MDAGTSRMQRDAVDGREYQHGVALCYQYFGMVGCFVLDSRCVCSKDVSVVWQWKRTGGMIS